VSLTTSRHAATGHWNGAATTGTFGPDVERDSVPHLHGFTCPGVSAMRTVLAKVVCGLVVAGAMVAAVFVVGCAGVLRQ
jgi:hypothetical protein